MADEKLIYLSPLFESQKSIMDSFCVLATLRLRISKLKAGGKGAQRARDFCSPLSLVLGHFSLSPFRLNGTSLRMSDLLDNAPAV